MANINIIAIIADNRKIHASDGMMILYLEFLDTPQIMTVNEILEQEWLDGARYGELETLIQIYNECKNNNIETFVQCKTLTGNTALHMACANGHIGIVKFLICDINEPVNIKNDEGNTPLHWAAINGHFEIVEFLLQNGALPEECNSQGHTALFEAQRHGHEQVINRLLLHIISEHQVY